MKVQKVPERVIARAKPEAIPLFPPVSPLFPLHLGRVSGGKGGDSFASLKNDNYTFQTFYTFVNTDEAAKSEEIHILRLYYPKGVII